MVLLVVLPLFAVVLFCAWAEWEKARIDKELLDWAKELNKSVDDMMENWVKRMEKMK